MNEEQKNKKDTDIKKTKMSKQKTKIHGIRQRKISRLFVNICVKNGEIDVNVVQT